MSMLEVGQHVWLPDDEHSWIPGKVVESTPDAGATVDVPSELGGGSKAFKPNEVRDLIVIHPSCLKGVEDMVTLGDLHEAGLMHTLRIRYQRDEIYTYTGAILVSVNPYQMLPIYGPETIKEYRGQLIGALPPHVFAVADSSFSAMSEDGSNQSIIISGESGAGKTEATKLILQYLAAVSGNHSWLMQQILDSSPILEAFGNAKTLRNDNSSRFGKFMEIHFDTKNEIVGASIENYLLEKSRIVHQAEGERNYHIFYQITKGTPAEDKAKYKIKSANEYEFLNKSGVVDLDGVDDAADFNTVKMAMEVLQFSEEEIDAIHRILSAVLLCGNVQFNSLADGEKCAPKDAGLIADIADVLQTDPARWAKAMTERTMVTRGETFKIAYKFAESRETVLAFCKSIYTRMFDWIVQRINDSIRKAKRQRFIGVLDIFGFEIFQQNLFEQFCINFANEKLQQHFNHFIFKVEQQEYNKEKIDWSTIEFVDNQECLDLVEKRPVGIIHLIDEQCKAPKATDKILLEKLHKNHEKHPYYEAPKRSQTTFIIKHYAGEVTYEIDGFLEKNKDTLYLDFTECMQASKSATIQKLFKDDTAQSKDSGKAQGGKQTVASFFKQQLTSLMDVLNSTAPHFVRCIKPNQVKKPRVFEAPFILRQLRYAGMMEAVRIRRMGFPIRRTPKEFYLRYRCLHDPGALVAGQEKELAKKICEALELGPSQHQFGLTKIFLREQVHQSLEDRRQSKWKEMILVIQAFCNMTRDRRFFKEVVSAASHTQRVARGFLGRKQYLDDWRGRDRSVADANTALMKQEDAYCSAIASHYKKIETDREAQHRELMRQEEKYLREVFLENKKQDILRQKRELEHFRAEEKYQRAVEAALLEAAATAAAANAADSEAAKAAMEKLEKAKKAAAQADENAAKPSNDTGVEGDDDLDSILAALDSEKNDLEQKLAGVSDANYSEDSPAAGTGKNMVGAQVKALFDFAAVDESQLSIKADDLIIIVQMDDSGWARGELGDQVGWFPFDFVEVVAEAPPTAGEDGGEAGEPIVPGCIVKALFAFDGMDASQLTFEKDALIVVVENDESGWCQGKLVSNEQKGWYPADYVTLVEAPKEGSQDRSAAGPGVSMGKDLKELKLETTDGGGAGGAGGDGSGGAGGGGGGDKKDGGSIFVEGSASLPLPKDIHKYTLESLAKQYFSEQKTGTFRKRTVNAVDMTVWSKDPIKQPLFKIDKPDLAQEAVAVFHSIMKYMGDYASKKDNLMLIEHVIVKGMIPELRDEIYAQLCKQVTQHPNKENILKGWELLSFCTGFFAPTKAAENHVRNFFKQSTRYAGQIGDYAGYCARNIARTIVNGSRQFTPSRMEIEALKSHRPIILRIHFLDGTSKGIAVESQTTVKEVVRHLSRKLGIKYQSAFALFENSAEGSPTKGAYEKLLKGEEHILDIVAEFEANKIMDGKLVFKNRLYFKQFATMEDPGLRAMLYIQTVAFVLSNVYMVTTDEAVELAALQMHVQNQGKKPQNTAFISETPEVLIPRALVKSQDGAAWEKAIMARHQSVEGLSVEEAQRKYVAIMQEKKFFGLSFYEVDQTVAVGNVPSHFILGVSCDGVHFLNPTNLEEYAFYAYGSVANWGFSSSTFVIITGDMRRQTKYLLKTKYGTEISSLVQTYISQVAA